MTLPDHDERYLADRCLDYEVVVDQGMTCVVISQWRLPPGYQIEMADLLLRLSSGYPDVAPDMWWFDPPLSRADGQEIPATQVIETYFGRQWQRWSRHFNGNQWQSGVDGIESFLALIRRDVTRWSGSESESGT